MKIPVIIMHEYLSRVKTKGFIIGTLIMPVMMLGLIFLPTYLMRLKTDDVKTIVVADPAGIYFDSLHQALSGDKTLRLIRAGDQESQDIKALSQQVLDRDYFGFIHIPMDVQEASKASFYSTNPSNFMLNREVKNALTNLVINLRVAETDMDRNEISRLIRSVDLETFKISREGQVAKDEGSSFMLAYILGFALYLGILIYGIMVMNSIIEEKTSRVYEVILSSIKPLPLLLGKLIGVSLLGVTQFLVWIGFGVLIFFYAGMILAGSGSGAGGAPSIEYLAILSQTPVSMWFFFVLYFILGYFSFAALYAIVGAAVNNQTEAQNIQSPITLLIVFTFMFMFFTINNPDSQLSVILSIMPLTAPILMMVRMSIHYPPMWQIGLSILMQIAGFFGLMIISARIYRIGILMYGKPPSLKELAYWIRQK